MSFYRKSSVQNIEVIAGSFPIDFTEQLVNNAEQTHFTKLRIIKNLIVISLSFVLLYTAYDGVSMLQSTMNRKNGVGTISQAVVYFCFGLTSLLLPKYVIKRMGCKKGLLLATSLFWPYQAANLFPEYSTMMPSAILVGVGGSLIWAIQCTYFNECAIMYVRLTRETGRQRKEHKNYASLSGANVHLVSVKEVEDPSDILPEDSTIIKCLSLPKYSQDKDLTNCTFSEFGSRKEVIMTKPLKLGVIIRNPKQSDALRQHDFEPNERSLPKQCVKVITVSKGMVNTQSIYNNSNKDVLAEHVAKSSSYPGLVNSCAEMCLKNIEHSVAITKETSELKLLKDNFDPISRQTNYISDIECITARFFGCHGLAYFTSQILSNLITYYILNMNTLHEARSTNLSCGASYCESGYRNFSTTASDINPYSRFLLSIITVALSLMAVLVVLFFLDSLNNDKEPISFSLDTLMATLKYFKKREQFLLIPLAIFNGMTQGFYTADFTKSYIRCAWSTAHVGLVTISYGLFCGVTSTVSGYFVNFLGRVPIMLTCQVINIGVHVFLLLWEPDANNTGMFFLGAGLWGAILGVFWPQTQSFIGLVSRKEEEAAFAGYYLCSAVGWFFTFVISDYMCTYIKLYILLTVSTVGIVGYLTAERDFKLKNNNLCN